MAVTTKHLTYDDLERIPQAHPGDRHEIIDGELAVTASPAWDHQTISANIFRVLDRLVGDHSLGVVRYAPIDVRFTSDTVLVPDLIFIASDRLHIAGPRTVDGAPDLVVEILSPGTSQRDLTVKRDLYARFGVREYWIVDPANRSLTVLELRGDRYHPVPLRDDQAVPSRVLPGLDLPLDAVFADLR